MKIYHPPLIPPIEGGKVPSPLVGEGYFRVKDSSILQKRNPSYRRIQVCKHRRVQVCNLNP
ncbi:MAG: hypothetical protein FJ266_09940 [Planctomycetes bacterium]|nr:hypothetical protein [Planctomycetota bacterium]